MEQRICQNCRTNFTVFDEDFAFYKKFDVPAPKECPECRLMRRLNWRNARTLYYRKCDLSGKEIISQYHASQPFPVYANEIWWSDQWNPLEYGQDFDFSRPFFEQFHELMKRVPVPATFVKQSTMVNSDYCNCADYLKNCYLVFESDYAEDSYYSNILKNCKNIVDGYNMHDSQLCYECLDCISCYNLQYSQDCINCRDSYFLKNCQGCSDCIGCINQRHRQYMIFNTQYSKEEYLKLKKEMGLAKRSGVNKLRQKSSELFSTAIHKALQMEHNENSFGDHLYDSKNAYYCFDSRDLEDCRYCAKISLKVKSSMDYSSWGLNSELIYYSSSCGSNAYNLKFCTHCWQNVRDLTYCYFCTASRDCFGCVGLKQQQYCILNKRYSKENYENLRRKIVEHMKKNDEWGEFFPIEFSPFGYNETIGMDYFPLTREEALKRGYQWKEKDPKEYQPSKYKLPDDIADVSDGILNEILACGVCGKNYRLTSQELQWYRQQEIPVPENCPDCRHFVRTKLRNQKRFFDRACQKCGDRVTTTFSLNHPEIVYCEKCYLETVY